MFRPARIELTGGPGPVGRAIALAVWLASGVLLAFLAPRLAWPWVGAGMAAWLLEWPGRRQTRYRDTHLSLYPDGSAEIDGAPGSWDGGAWSTGPLSMVTLRTDRCRRFLVLASRNDPRHYRTLRCWLRHSPRSGPSGVGRGQRGTV